MKRNFKNEFKSFLIIEMNRKTNLSYSDLIVHVNEFVETKEGIEAYKKWTNAKLLEHNKNKPKHISTCFKE